MDNAPVEWSTLEFEPSPQHSRALLTVSVIFVAVIAYALVQNSPIMAITFVLLGTVTFLQSRGTPKRIKCLIDRKTIRIGEEVYPVENILSFWIEYSPNEKRLTLKTSGAFISTVRVPLGDASPNAVREALTAIGLREERYSPTVIDTLSDFLHI